MKSVDAGCVDIRYLVMGMIENNVYIISDGLGTFVVDPTTQADHIIEALGGVAIDAIVLTHHHFDHMGAAYELREATGAPVIASAREAPHIEEQERVSREFHKLKACPVDHKVADGDTVTIGSMTWKIISTPGHTLGSICMYLSPEFGCYPDKAPVLISGDTLFYASIGRTDFEGGSMSDMRASLKKLAMLPDATLVLPGHNDVTSIGAERQRVFAAYA